MKKRFGPILLLMLTIFSLLSSVSVTASASQVSRAPRVLLAYDSENRANDDQTKIDAMQRLLTSLNLEVHTIRIDQYHAGDIKRLHFKAVITMVNWSQAKLTTSDFAHDRAAFKGLKLHIGPSMATDERQSLGLTLSPRYHQQYWLSDHTSSARQLLSFSESLAVTTQTPATVKTFGTLVPQSQNAKKVPYGVINGNSAYLPYLTANGLSFIVASRLIARFFGHTATYAPLLTITDVTPFTNMDLLHKLATDLENNGIPFAISTTSISVNTDLPAYKRFTSELQWVENHGGVVFLRTPVVYYPKASTQGQLKQLMQTQIWRLIDRQVFPVGLSAPNYWNQDLVYRPAALSYSNNVILMQNPSETKNADADNTAGVYKQAFYGLQEQSLETVHNGTNLAQTDLSFSSPTAVTMTMPDSQKDLTGLVKRVSAAKVSWLDPSAGKFSGTTTVANQRAHYRNGNYYLNGQLTVVPTYNPPKQTKPAPVTPTGALNTFFSVDGVFLFFFMIVSLIVLLAFYIVGRQVYWRMFKKK
ncbi:hypothetical protein [Furfurilactobacillus milii]|uniref:DUF2334 domain-containing protein n=1 Tax=Furfurilactobacillus milii TaxID=2888272 RepID=A0A6N9HZT0_9LACO|nr:hypothetical protein [Furfurilactobacillus milii]MYV16200.1 hypothetical protein [Furfurilactobacillus milii]